MTIEIRFEDKYPNLSKYCIDKINNDEDLYSIVESLNSSYHDKETKKAVDEYLLIPDNEDYKFFRFLADESVRYYSSLLPNY